MPDINAAVLSVVRATFALIVVAVLSTAPARAQSQDPARSLSPEVHEFIKLLDDPSVRAWIKQNAAAASSVSAAGEAPAPASPSRYFADRLTAVRQHLADLAASIPTLSTQMRGVGANLGLEFQEQGIIHVLLLIILFFGLGCVLEWLFRRLVSGFARWAIGMTLDTVGQRLRAVGVRLGVGIGMVAAFALGSVGAFLANDWPPLLREIVLGYLLAIVVLRTALVVGRFVLAPREERFRVLPMTTEAARFWYWRLGGAVGWFTFGWVSVGLLNTLGLSVPGRQLIAYALGLGLLLIGLEAVWRRPATWATGSEPSIVPEDGSRQTIRRAINSLVSGYFVLLWLLWTIGIMPAFWLAVIALALPAMMRLTKRAADHILRPAYNDKAPAEVPSVAAVLLERGLRVMLIIGAALVLIHAWQIDLGALTGSDTVVTRLVRGAVNALLILLVADVAWRLLRALIDRRIAAAQIPGRPDTEEGRRRSRMLTLLPILRNFLLAMLLVMAILMALSALGVQIGPLIAGAGVIGVAAGFGAQTLVKDIISGVFYLLDDAFRIGEYIQSGSYKGTVESFSLRSVKLRHHRGPLYTVPFGQLGAVENMSRDWVIDKMMVGITYDSDLDKAKKIIKQIGKELAADPDFAPHIIEPLKMQGVEQFGDYAIQIRMKMMTKPNEQFVIRRKALALIKRNFDANGIKFAFPTVQVAGGNADAGAAAQQGIAMAKPAPVN